MARLDKAAWIDQGFKILKAEGAAGLTIESLTRALKRTKGSFYHHFKNREGYLIALLSEWEEKQTRDIIRASREKRTFDEINQALMTLSGKAVDPQIEVAIRAWALRDALAREFQERIDSQRVEFLKQMFSLISSGGEEIDRFAMIRYSFYIGSLQIIPAMDDGEYRENLDLLTRMFKTESHI